MTVRNVIEGTLVLVLLVLLGVIGWQTVVNRKAVDEVTAKLGPLPDEIKALTTKSNELININSDQQTKVNELISISAHQKKQLLVLVEHLPDGSYIHNIRTIMDRPESRQEFKKAIDDNISRGKGELWVYNDTQSEQRLRVNGESWYGVPVNRGLIFTVPSGTATTEIPGDGSKSWFIGVPNYRQVLTIVPRERHQVQTIRTVRLFRGTPLVGLPRTEVVRALPGSGQ